jgi:hypothetical protein
MMSMRSPLSPPNHHSSVAGEIDGADRPRLVAVAVERGRDRDHLARHAGIEPAFGEAVIVGRAEQVAAIRSVFTTLSKA